MNGLMVATPEAWRRLQIGQKLSIVSEQAVLEMTDGKGPFPLKGIVNEITGLREARNRAEWLFFHLINEETNLLSGIVMAKISGPIVKVVLLRQSPFFNASSRGDLIENENLFLFSPPNMNDWNSSTVEQRIVNIAPTLVFSGFFERNALAGDGKEWRYVQRSDREFKCNSAAISRNGKEDSFRTISEYGAEVIDVDPELIVIEDGKAGEEGLINVLTGREISCDEIYVN